MILHDSNPKYGFEVVFERGLPQIWSQNLPKPVLHGRVHGFGTGFGVGFAQKQLQNHIWHQNYEKS